MRDSIFIKLVIIQTIVTESRSVLSGGMTGTDRMVRLQRVTRKLLRVMDMFIFLIVVMVSQIHTYTETSNFTL